MALNTITSVITININELSHSFKRQKNVILDFQNIQIFAAYKRYIRIQKK